VNLRLARNRTVILLLVVAGSHGPERLPNPSTLLSSSLRTPRCADVSRPFAKIVLPFVIDGGHCGPGDEWVLSVWPYAGLPSCAAGEAAPRHFSPREQEVAGHSVARRCS
jgi:hypothetical protein